MKRAKDEQKNPRNRIMRAATSLFARRGFAATTTREIARRARVNSALVFYYFGNKERLYYAVYEELWKTSSWYERRRNVYRNGAPDTAPIPRLALEVLSSLHEDDTIMRLGLFAGLEDSQGSRRLSERFFKTYISETYELLAAYIQERIREGEFRDIPPLIAARALIGVVAYQHIIHEFLGGKYVDEFSGKELSHILADIWLHGVLARPLKEPSSQKATA